MTEHFNESSFSAAVAQGVTLVDFWATWCMPCRMVAPVIDRLADDFDGRATVGKVDVDEEQELARQFGVMSIPTVVLFKDGKEVGRQVGAIAKFVLEEKLKALL